MSGIPIDIIAEWLSGAAGVRRTPVRSLHAEPEKYRRTGRTFRNVLRALTTASEGRNCIVLANDYRQNRWLCDHAGRIVHAACLDGVLVDTPGCRIRMPNTAQILFRTIAQLQASPIRPDQWMMGLCDDAAERERSPYAVFDERWDPS